MLGNSTTPAANANKHLYNGGSEWQNDYADLPDYYRTFYRNYDATIGRFVGVDPEAASADNWTVYQYAYNNPGMLNDPMGDVANPFGQDYSQGMYSKQQPYLYMSRAEAQAVMGENAFEQGGLYAYLNTILDYNHDYSSFWGGLSTSGADPNAYLAGYQSAAKMSNGGGVYTYFAQDGSVSFLPSGNKHSALAMQNDNGYVFYDFIFNNKSISNKVTNIYEPPGWAKNFNDINSGLGVTSGTTTELLTFAIASHFKTATNNWTFSKLAANQQLWRETRALGKTGSKLLKFTKWLGVAGNVAGSIYSGNMVYNQFQSGGIGEVLSHRDVLDGTISTGGLVVTGLVAFGYISNPIGWTIGVGTLLYGAGTLAWDAYHDK